MEAKVPHSRSAIAGSTSNVPLWEVLKDYIADQIIKDAYPAGSWLPSVRQLGEQVNVNRNTVSKAYQSLGVDGIVEVVHGKGVRVVRKPTHTNAARERVELAIESSVREAALLGLSSDWVLERVQASLTEYYTPTHVNVAFVECTVPDVVNMAKDLSDILGVKVSPIELSDIERDPARIAEEFDLVATTLFHLQEVISVMSPEEIKVIGIHHAVSHESILELARLPRGSKVVIISPNQRTTARISSVVTDYTDASYEAFTLDQLYELERALQEADVVVTVSSTRELAAKLAPDLPVLTITFQIESPSLDYLREQVLELQKATSS
jgi:GntR family transcriptional regulator